RRERDVLDRDPARVQQLVGADVADVVPGGRGAARVDDRYRDARAAGGEAVQIPGAAPVRVALCRVGQAAARAGRDLLPGRVDREGDRLRPQVLDAERQQAVRALQVDDAGAGLGGEVRVDEPEHLAEGVRHVRLDRLDAHG